VAAFKNPQTGAPHISTGQTDEAAAIEAVFAWYREGIP
jgi:hypothetical protein